MTARLDQIKVDGEIYIRIDLAAAKLEINLQTLRGYLRQDFAGDKLRSVKIGTTYVSEIDLAGFNRPARGNPNMKLYRSSSKWKARAMAATLHNRAKRRAVKDDAK